MRPSLFVVGLPRSLSSLLYHAVRRALALREPDWTTDGEILNVSRFAFLAQKGAVEGVKYIERRCDVRRFDCLSNFLAQVTCAEGFAYKDVIQPFLMAEWLPASGFRVLHLDRPVPDVAWAMLRRGWLYPARAAGGPSGAAGVRDQEGLERSLVMGLLRARQALDSVGGTRVLFDELIHDEAPLWTALRSLYGDDVPQPEYLTRSFCRHRAEVLRRRDTALYERLAALSQHPLLPRSLAPSQSGAQVRFPTNG